MSYNLAFRSVGIQLVISGAHLIRRTEMPDGFDL